MQKMFMEIKLIVVAPWISPSIMVNCILDNIIIWFSVTTFTLIIPSVLLVRVLIRNRTGFD